MCSKWLAEHLQPPVEHKNSYIRRMNRLDPARQAQMGNPTYIKTATGRSEGPFRHGRSQPAMHSGGLEDPSHRFAVSHNIWGRPGGLTDPVRGTLGRHRPKSLARRAWAGAAAFATISPQHANLAYRYVPADTHRIPIEKVKADATVRPASTTLRPRVHASRRGSVPAPGPDRRGHHPGPLGHRQPGPTPRPSTRSGPDPRRTARTTSRRPQPSRSGPPL